MRELSVPCKNELKVLVFWAVYMNEITTFHAAIAHIGGPKRAAEICSISVRAVYKWLAKGSLPRTEYTGETKYAGLLSESAKGAFTAEQLKKLAAPISYKASE